MTQDGPGTLRRGPSVDGWACRGGGGFTSTEHMESRNSLQSLRRVKEGPTTLLALKTTPHAPPGPKRGNPRTNLGEDSAPPRPRVVRVSSVPRVPCEVDPPLPTPPVLQVETEPADEPPPPLLSFRAAASSVRFLSFCTGGFPIRPQAPVQLLSFDPSIPSVPLYLDATETRLRVHSDGVERLSSVDNDTPWTCSILRMEFDSNAEHFLSMASVEEPTYVGDSEEGESPLRTHNSWRPVFGSKTQGRLVCPVVVDNKPVAPGYYRPLGNGHHVTFEYLPTQREFRFIFVVPPQQDDVDDDTDGEVAYRRGAILGHGAFGTVYQGMNKATGELIAIKSIETRACGTDSNHLWEEMTREIRLLKRLRHDHIVKYLGSDSCNGQLNILLEYIPGGSIASLLTRFGTFSESVIRLYVAQILFGLQYLHANNVLHRDIKGANVLVSDRGVVKLTDFGLSSHEGTGGVVGTIAWMAPETMERGLCVRPSDVWGVGCTVLEMADGMPWKGVDFSNHAAAMYQIATRGSPPLPSRLGCSALDFLARCLETDLNERADCEGLLRHNFIIVPPAYKPEKSAWHLNPMGSTTFLTLGGGLDDDEEEDDDDDDNDPPNAEITIRPPRGGVRPRLSSPDIHADLMAHRTWMKRRGTTFLSGSMTFPSSSSEDSVEKSAV